MRRFDKVANVDLTNIDCGVKNRAKNSAKSALTPLQIFKELCKIPHRSYHTHEMFDYLCTFCENLGLEVRTDKARNIYICQKPQKCEITKSSNNADKDLPKISTHNAPKSTSKTSPKISSKHSPKISPKISSKALSKHLPKIQQQIQPKICLQAHYDMVGVGRAERGDSIEPYVDGQFLRARKSSLGADNGAGVAAILWLFMQEKYAPYIEAILTNDEEVGLCGASKLEIPIKSHFLLNVDSEFFGEIITGCAGGFDVEFDFKITHPNTRQNLHFYEIVAFGFEGGHSGVDIHREICSSIVEFARLLEVLSRDFVCELYSLKAGEKSNSIPVGLEAIMGFSLKSDELKTALAKAGLEVESTLDMSDLREKRFVKNDILRVGLVANRIKNENLKMGFLLKPYRNIGDYKQILEQKPYDKSLLSKLILELKHGVWERENDSVVSSLNIAMIEDSSPLGMRRDRILEILECADDKSANIPKNPKSLHSHTHSHTANAKIINKKSADFGTNAESSDFVAQSSLENPQDFCGNPKSTFFAEACAAETCAQSHNAKNVKNVKNALHFTLKARANTNPLLKSAKKQIIHIIQNLLENPQIPHNLQKPQPTNPASKAHTNIIISNEYGAWANPNDSTTKSDDKSAKHDKCESSAQISHPILQMIIDAYKWRHCEVGSIHAGLECGILQERFSQMGLEKIAMASIGPTILSPHSLQERLDIGSFEEFMEVLECLVANICANAESI